MKLSIVIPYYNGEKWVSRCLDSLLCQDIPTEDYEIIVVDDGSTHSVEILKEYVQAHPNIKYIHQENARHSAARNKGLSVAKGDYVFFCDCDDYVAENVFGRLCEIAKSNASDVLLFHVRQLAEGEVVTNVKRNFDVTESFKKGLDYLSQPPCKVSAGPWEFMVRRQFMEEKGLRFSPEMIMREEFLFYLQMMQVAGPVTTVDVDVYFYIQYPTSWVHSEGKKKNHKRYIQCMFTFLKYLKGFKEDQNVKSAVSDQCKKQLDSFFGSETFIILHNIFRYSSVKDNVSMIRQLKSIGAYPIKNSQNKIVRIMNMYPLWMMACVCFHLLPAKIRYKYF